MNYVAPITTSVVPRGMSQQHEFAARARRPRATIFLIVMRKLRELKAVRRPRVSFGIPVKAMPAKEARA